MTALVTRGLVLVLAAFVLACAPKPPAPETTTPATTAVEDYAREMSVEFIDVRLERDFMYITCDVSNHGPRTVTYWKVAVKFHDVNDVVIDTDYTNSPETLGPGETKRAELMHRRNPAIKNFIFRLEEVVTR